MAALLLAAGIFAVLAFAIQSWGAPGSARCPRNGSGNAPVIGGTVVVSASGVIISTRPDRHLRCPQFPGTLAVVPGTTVVVTTSPVFGTPGALSRVRYGSSGAGRSEVTVFRARRLGTGVLWARNFLLRITVGRPSA